MNASILRVKNFAFLAFLFAVFISGELRAQHNAVGADTLQLQGASLHSPVTLSLTDIKAMPHISVTVHNPHANAEETYSGVRLADLLIKLNAPLGKELHGGRSKTTLSQPVRTDTGPC